MPESTLADQELQEPPSRFRRRSYRSIAPIYSHTAYIEGILRYVEWLYRALRASVHTRLRHGDSSNTGESEAFASLCGLRSPSEPTEIFGTLGAWVETPSGESQAMFGPRRL